MNNSPRSLISLGLAVAGMLYVVFTPLVSLAQTNDNTTWGQQPPAQSVPSAATTDNCNGYFVSSDCASDSTYTAPTDASMQIYTTVATNVGPASARLNGLISSQFGALPATYFEFGTSTANLVPTNAQFVPSGPEIGFYQTVSATPNTKYYFRAVARDRDTLVRGSIESFTTPSTDVIGGEAPDNYLSFIGFGSDEKKSGTGASATAGVTLLIKDQSDKLSVGDTVGYTIGYHNGSEQALTDATLVVTLPQGFTLKQGTNGQMVSATTFQSTLGTIAAGADGSLFVEATVDNSVARNETLVTNATLSFTLPNGKQDSAVGYVLNHVTQSSAIGGLAIGAGFFPTTIFGWFMTILIILIMILVVRRIVRGKLGGHGASGHDGHH